MPNWGTPNRKFTEACIGATRIELCVHAVATVLVALLAPAKT